MSSDEDKLHEIERELRMRRRVFPRWVADNRMSKEAADRRMKVLEDIAADYRARLTVPSLPFEP